MHVNLKTCGPVPLLTMPCTGMVVCQQSNDIKPTGLFTNM